MTSRRWAPEGPPGWLEEWARFLLRYIVGAGGCIWQVVIDHFAHSETLVIFAGLAGLPDVVAFHVEQKHRRAAKPEPEPEES